MRRLQDVGLLLLVLVAGVLTALTFTSVTGPAPDRGPTDPSSEGGPTGPVGLVADLSAVTSGAPGDTTGGTADDAAATGAGRPPDLDAVRDVLADGAPVVVAALGDSTGNETWEWVYEWGRALASDRPVEVVSWNEWTEDGYIDPVELGSGQDGGTVTLYAGHQSGAGAAYPAGRLEALVPEEPDLVILNYGHNDTVDSVRSGTADTLEALRQRFGGGLPVVVTLQQPQADDANAEVRAALADLAADEGLPTIDVAAAFEATGDPAVLLADTVHPDEDGAALWARTVDGTLTGP